MGYGDGGRYFHAPFIEAATDVELAGVVTRSQERRRVLAADHPDVPVYSTIAELLAAGIDAVTITTPPQSRRELVRAVQDMGVALSVFHNRRWDSDVRPPVSGLWSKAYSGSCGGLNRVLILISPDTLDRPGAVAARPG